MINADFCRRQAEDCLQLAQKMRSAAAKQRMTDVAADWEHLASRADMHDGQKQAGAPDSVLF